MTPTHAALPPDLASALAARPELAGAVVRYFPELASTNDTAAALAGSGAADGTTVVAGRQTAGRGRRGRAWDSPPGAGLYLSVVLRGRQPPVVTLLAGVAVAEAVRGTAGVAAELKWPNDVVVTPAGGRACAPAPGGLPPADVPPGTSPAGGRACAPAPGGVSAPAPGGASAFARRKIAGILTEALPAGGGGDAAAVVGIGVNVGTRAFPPELAGRAAAIETVAGRRVDRAALCAELLVRLRRWRLRMADEGERLVVARWRALAPSSRGAPVSWCAGGTRRRGVTAGVDDGGALLVADGGRTERIVGGEVRWE